MPDGSLVPSIPSPPPKPYVSPRRQRELDALPATSDGRSNVVLAYLRPRSRARAERAAAAALRGERPTIADELTRLVVARATALHERFPHSLYTLAVAGCGVTIEWSEDIAEPVMVVTERLRCILLPQRTRLVARKNEGAIATLVARKLTREVNDDVRCACAEAAEREAA
jgi:hypothetical protein